MSDEVDAKIATHLGRMSPDAVGRLRARGEQGRSSPDAPSLLKGPHPTPADARATFSR